MSLVDTTTGELVDLPCQVSAVSLVIPDGLTFDQWSDLGDRLSRMAEGVMWWVGDWWRFGDHAYGERASQALDSSRWSYGTFANAGWVASRIETSRRREVLPFSWHQEVAPLDPVDQDELLDEATAEGWSQRELRAAVRRRRRPTLATPALPDGEYRTIVIDPPWPVEKIGREVRPNQVDMDYATMSLEDIGALNVGSLAFDEGCHLYLWTTQKLLPNALEFAESWGFQYQCLMTWVKNVGITPFSWMYDTEHVIFAKRGSLPLEVNGLRLSFSAPVTQHSEKPDVFYGRVLAASPEPRLDMFPGREREGFTSWGYLHREDRVVGG